MYFLETPRNLFDFALRLNKLDQNKKILLRCRVKLNASHSVRSISGRYAQRALMNESIYLGGWEVDFKNEEELRNFIIQHRLNKKGFEVFTAIQSGLEIKTENGEILEVLNRLGDEKVSGPLDLTIPDSETHQLFWLRPSASGRHQLGGKYQMNLNL